MTKKLHKTQPRLQKTLHQELTRGTGAGQIAARSEPSAAPADVRSDRPQTLRRRCMPTTPTTANHRGIDRRPGRACALKRGARSNG